MPRYIILSFALLGWAGYEMSGGADFQPPKRPEPAVAEAPTKARETVVRVAAAPVDATAMVATPAIQPRTPRQVLQDNAEAIAAAKTDQRLDQVRASLRQGLPLFPDSADRREKVASLQDIATSASFEAPPSEVAPAPASPADAVRPAVGAGADLREISATRVNMRADPTTDAPILARLNRGQKVEVLGNNGDGWLRLRTVPDDQVGWIAERLVGPAAN